MGFTKLPNELKNAVLDRLPIADKIKGKSVLKKQTHRSNEIDMLLSKYMHLVLYIHDVALRTMKYMHNLDFEDDECTQDITLDIYDENDKKVFYVNVYSLERDDEIYIAFNDNSRIYVEEIESFMNTTNQPHSGSKLLGFLVNTTTYTDKLNYFSMIKVIEEQKDDELKKKAIKKLYSAFKDKLKANVTKTEFIKELSDKYLDCSIEYAFVKFLKVLMNCNPHFKIKVKIPDKFMCDEMTKVYQNIIDKFLTTDLTSRPGTRVRMPVKPVDPIPKYTQKKRIALSKPLLQILHQSHARCMNMYKDILRQMMKGISHFPENQRNKLITNHVSKLKGVTFRFNILLRHVLVCLEKYEVDPKKFVYQISNWLIAKPKTLELYKKHFFLEGNHSDVLTYERKYKLPTPRYFVR